MYKYDEPVYLISVVAKMLSIHPQTLRQYEKEGLLTPERTEGKMRLYSQRDLDKITSIVKLTRDMGINLAGVNMILRLKERLDELDLVVESLRESLNKKEENNKVKAKSKTKTNANNKQDEDDIKDEMLEKNKRLVEKSSFNIIAFNLIKKS